MLFDTVNENDPSGSQFCALQGWGSSFERQIGKGQFAMRRTHNHTSDLPDTPDWVSELSTLTTLSREVAPCGTRPARDIAWLLLVKLGLVPGPIGVLRWFPLVAIACKCGSWWNVNRLVKGSVSVH
jgi:hypothetical protein